ncbi:CgeB family protein [Paenibacillus sacheonensis]|uniref:Glycosyltransferase n=1 Tax=Paenibacillus sacheonensis TaxID=742054 RepID=A0A7X4YSH0_9BACL|nr:glycosyltransferase [Paenibacillus sacheonensis]MBM7569279.1 spore maturation protein CgeB [Paenibacillus sacheonensis]NBC71711.1 glycosyltransferase [Paenibacillus sacheonensis]
MTTRRKRQRRRGTGRDAHQGRAEGFRLGWEHGHWFGRCEAALLAGAEPPPPIVQAHILFVASGKGFPYSPLDIAIADAFRGQAAQLTITDTKQPVADLALRIRPDFVIVLDGLEFDVAHVDRMRAGGIRTAIWFTDDPYYTDITSKIAPHYDVIFTLELICVDYYKQIGCPNVHYLSLGSDPLAFRPRNPERSQRHEICFIGSAYWKRVAFFDQLTRYLAAKDTHISGIWWERLKEFNLLASKIELGRWMDPLETANMYNGAKIVINMHRSPDDDTFNNNSAGIQAISPNPRTFEISGCATLQLTDVRDDLVSFYTPGVDIVTYASPQEMIEKIQYYLAHEEERQAIAMRGMIRTMREHTYAKRIQRMLGLLFPG